MVLYRLNLSNRWFLKKSSMKFFRNKKYLNGIYVKVLNEVV